MTVALVETQYILPDGLDQEELARDLSTRTGVRCTIERYHELDGHRSFVLRGAGLGHLEISLDSDRVTIDALSPMNPYLFRQACAAVERRGGQAKRPSSSLAPSDEMALRWSQLPWGYRLRNGLYGQIVAGSIALVVLPFILLMRSLQLLFRRR
jgi:hypothetical protein